jgi:hypothetical protein|tara:strand:- start:14919 stop:15722 length:804 start_codon:yes stop_codon:yes gene_type:complete
MELKNDIRIESWSELCDRVYDNSFQPSLDRFRANFAFRGISDKNYNLESRFARTCKGNVHLEYHLLRNFRKYAGDNHQDALNSDWRTLTIGQHYGLPTRLLDWTYSPFVAIHFATADINKFGCDGVIWKVDFVKAHKVLPSKLKSILEDVGSNSFTIEMLDEVLPTLKDFDTLTGETQALFFEPPSIDSRIVNQFAFFSVMSDPLATFNHWLNNHPDLFTRIIIPKELKWEIRDKLDQANITERLLFPGLDGLAKWLERHYTPKTPI